MDEARRALAVRGGRRGSEAFAVLPEARLAGGDAGAAVSFFRAAMEDDPWSPRLPSRLAVALARIGDDAGAREALRRAELLAADAEWRDR